MPKVRLGDVAKEYKLTIKEHKGMPVVGLEHLEPQELSLKSYDIDDEKTFSKGFKKGHILFGRRRAYLKKAAVAPFDGVCSGDIIVIEALPEKIIPDLLPFIIQNDHLFDYAMSKSAGGMSPRVKWKDLKEYQFFLPERQEQDRLLQVLASAYEVRSRYKELIIAIDELVKSQFIEMFQGKGYPVKKGKELFKFASGKFLPETKRLDKGIPVFGGNGIAWYTDESLTDEDTIIIGRVGAYCGNVRLAKGPKWITDNAIYITQFKTDDFRLRFLENLMTVYDFHQYAGVAGQPKITQKPLEEQQYIIPPVVIQDKFSSFVEQSDKSKFELKLAIERIDDLIRSLMQQENL